MLFVCHYWQWPILISCVMCYYLCVLRWLMKPILALNCLLQIEQEWSEEESSVGDALALAFRCARFCSASLILFCFVFTSSTFYEASPLCTILCNLFPWLCRNRFNWFWYNLLIHAHDKYTHFEQTLFSSASDLGSLFKWAGPSEMCTQQRIRSACACAVYRIFTWRIANDADNEASEQTARMRREYMSEDAFLTLRRKTYEGCSKWNTYCPLARYPRGAR